MAPKKPPDPVAPALAPPAPASSPALTELLSLTAPRPAPAASGASSLTHDPAIHGAKQNKTTVTLGLDPSFTRTAARAAKLNEVLKHAAEMFARAQFEVRKYGKSKRDDYNALMRRDITTVEIPYFARVPKDPASETPGRELRYVQVICTSRYSVDKATVLRMETELGDAFAKLFVKAEERVLKPNTLELFKQILKDLGVPEDRIDPTMSVLFETNVCVSTQAGYEAEHKKLPEETRALLDQVVIRQQPSLKFPAL